MPFPSNGMARWGGGNDNWVGPGSRRTAIRASRSGEPGDPLTGLRHVAQLFGRIEKANFVTDDF